MKNKIFFFLTQLLLLFTMMFASGAGNVTALASGYSSSEDYITVSEDDMYFDSKSQRYVTQRQHDWYDFIDFWIKRVGLALTIVSMLIGFLIRRLDHANALFRAKALIFEIVVPVAYIFVAYGICLWADRFIG